MGRKLPKGIPAFAGKGNGQMNRYRLAGQWDSYNSFICLKCKNTFIHEDCPSNWKCCPICTTVWDGAFTKRKRRYWLPPPKKEYEMDPLTGKIGFCYVPRFMVETSTYTDKKLDNNSFSVICTKPRWTDWHSYSHCSLTANLFGESVSNCMMKAFKNAAKSHDRVRLILKRGNEIKLLKEISKY